MAHMPSTVIKSCLIINDILRPGCVVHTDVFKSNRVIRLNNDVIMMCLFALLQNVTQRSFLNK